MQEIKSIMVAVDLSDDSLVSLEYANWLASSMDAKLILANVFTHDEVDPLHRKLKALYGHLYFETLAESSMNARRDRLEQMAFKAHAEDRVKQQIVRMGYSRQELYSVVKEENPDLLIVGNKGHHRLSGGITGFSSCNVCRKCPIPVLNL